VTGEIQSLYTVYHYQEMNLLISYGVAIACSLASIVVGFIAYCQNGESHDAKISTIGAMMQNPEVSPAHFFPHHLIHFQPVLKMSHDGHIPVPVLVEEISSLATLLLLNLNDLACAALEKGRRCCTRRQR
jgi:hypothetical protein